MDETDSSSSAIVGGYDPVVFWCVNGFILVLLGTACGFYCWCFQGAGTGRPGATDSDHIYSETMLRRHQEALERKRENPTVRLEKLHAAIRRCGVRMVRVCYLLLCLRLNFLCCVMLRST